MSITDLDSITLIDIFSYLSVEDIVLSVRLTCKGWQEMSRDPHLWKTVWNGREADQLRSADSRRLKLLKFNVPRFESLIFDYNIAFNIERGIR